MSSAIVLRLGSSKSRPCTQPRQIFVIALALREEIALKELYRRAIDNVGCREIFSEHVGRRFQLSPNSRFNVLETAKAGRLVLVPALESSGGRRFERASIKKEPAKIRSAVITSRYRPELLFAKGVGQ